MVFPLGCLNGSRRMQTKTCRLGGWCHPAQQHVDARNAARGHVIVLIAGERGFEEVQNAARAVLVFMVPARSRKPPEYEFGIVRPTKFKSKSVDSLIEGPWDPPIQIGWGTL
jgi:hypothetical protein